MADQTRRAARRQKGAPLEQYTGDQAPAYVTVQRVDPASWTVDVSTDDGGLLRSVGLPTSGLYELPEIGDRLLVVYVHGQPSLLPSSPGGTTRLRGPSVLGLGQAATARTGAANTSPSAPSGLLPGDKALTGRDGNGLLVLRGGGNVLRSSDTTAVETHAEQELVRLSGRSLQVRTGGGELEWGSTAQGKSALRLDFGPDEAWEGGPRAANYRVQLRLGGGGALARMRFLSATGQDDAGWAIDAGGAVTAHAKRSSMRVAEDWRLEVGAARVQSTGDLELEGLGAARLEAGRNLQLRAGGSVQLAAVRDVSARAFGGLALQALRGMQLTANGALVPTPLSTALDVVATNGSMVLDLGNPLYGDLGTARSGLRVTTYTGDVSLTALTGTIALHTTVPASIKLGGPPTLPPPTGGAPGLFSAVIFERLAAYLAAFGAAIDSHVHPATGGATLPPVVPPFASTSAGLAAARSIYVTYGG